MLMPRKSIGEAFRFFSSPFQIVISIALHKTLEIKNALNANFPADNSNELNDFRENRFQN